ncbi:VOC family protein [Aneurinibacillus uraniidurans]|uniref:VOC family protein n=1 Tax=Aneurinibacillus uraniidurans TaxID=2966586 RepID=UPI00234AED64|nr:VOC family protein [Aneurinibacillus sp. B1]WCN37185.1 VOC family protein [Aneurinibacillus sp. B1]
MIRKAEHVALVVVDMDRSISFYTEMFGYQVRARGENAVREMAFLLHPNQPGFEIELIRDLASGSEYSTQSVVNHLAFTVDNIEEAMAYYGERGIIFTTEEPKRAIDGGRTIFFHGPDQELLQFVEPAGK